MTGVFLRATAVTQRWNGHWIRLGTQSWLSRRSCRDSHSQPFDHESGAQFRQTMTNIWGKLGRTYERMFVKSIRSKHNLSNHEWKTDSFFYDTRRTCSSLFVSRGLSTQEAASITSVAEQGELFHSASQHWKLLQLHPTKIKSREKIWRKKEVEWIGNVWILKVEILAEGEGRQYNLEREKKKLNELGTSESLK